MKPHWSTPLLWLIAVGVVCLGLGQLRWIERTFASLPVVQAGKFEERAPMPADHRGPGSGLRYWSSWNGNDAHVGALRLGPFTPPPAFKVWVRGYPAMEQNRLQLVQTVTGATYQPPVPNIGEGWAAVRIELPVDWHGSEILIHAVDDAQGWGGWLAISEPLAVPAWTRWWRGLWPVLNAVLLSGIVLGLLASAVAASLRQAPMFRGPGALLAAAAVIAALGYLIFWAYFAHRIAGGVFVALLFAAAVMLVFRERKAIGELWRDRDWLTPAVLATASVVMCTALLLLFEDDRPLAELAQHRYREGLPADNDIPHFFAERLRAGSSLKPFFGDWLSSDRPPLQTGWSLLLGPVARSCGLPSGDADHVAGFWFQALWISAGWWLLRGVRLRARLAAGLVAVVVPSGFYLINTTFVWPKLGAAALVIGAFVCWFVASSRRETSRAQFAMGGGLAALAWLAHGGIAFSLLATAPFALRQLLFRRNWKLWLAAAAVFLAFVGPWVAYQKFYDPPGNRLLKWHLAGVIPPNERGFTETLVAQYRTTPPEELWRNRGRNLYWLLGPDWERVLRFDLTHRQQWRDAQFFHLLPALGWWSLGFIALPMLAIRHRDQGGPRSIDTSFWQITAWLLLTLIIWVALMFQGWSTVIHQGSYAVPALLFPMLALALWRLHPIALCVVAAAQLWAFTALWMTPPPGMVGLPMRFESLLVVFASIAVLIVVVLRTEQPGAGVSPVKPVFAD